VVKNLETILPLVTLRPKTSLHVEKPQTAAALRHTTQSNTDACATSRDIHGTLMEKSAVRATGNTTTIRINAAESKITILSMEDAIKQLPIMAKLLKQTGS
jgi:hypothetical protein